MANGHFVLCVTIYFFSITSPIQTVTKEPIHGVLSKSTVKVALRSLKNFMCVVKASATLSTCVFSLLGRRAATKILL